MKTMIEHSFIQSRPPGIAVDETIFSEQFAPAPGPGRATAPSPGLIQWSWACRRLASLPYGSLEAAASAQPAPGDVALMRVEKTVFHKHLTTAENRRMRLYPGAQFIGVFGNRYACDAFEAEVLGPDNLSLLTAAGMVGTVKSKHHTAADPTQVSLLGYLRDAEGGRLNLKNRLFRPTATRRLPRNLICVVGTGMNRDRKSTRLNSSHGYQSRMPSSA